MGEGEELWEVGPPGPNAQLSAKLPGPRIVSETTAPTPFLKNPAEMDSRHLQSDLCRLMTSKGTPQMPWHYGRHQEGDSGSPGVISWISLPVDEMRTQSQDQVAFQGIKKEDVSCTPGVVTRFILAASLITLLKEPLAPPGYSDLSLRIGAHSHVPSLMTSQSHSSSLSATPKDLFLPPLKLEAHASPI